MKFRMMNDENSVAPCPSFDLHISPLRQKFPFCIVWTPIPVLTYLFPFIGHMGIATSDGTIRDFAGPYLVSENKMAFGWPTKYWQLDYTKAKGRIEGWNEAVNEASELYSGRIHNLFCDNCHSHVAKALNLMFYDNSNDWNMIKLAFYMFFCGKYVGFSGIAKSWAPFIITVIIIIFISIL